jgi:hypothetical protein
MFNRPRRLIVAQYRAPDGISLMAAAELLGDSKRAVGGLGEALSNLDFPELG